jgi:chromosome segregation ATPase
MENPLKTITGFLAILLGGVGVILTIAIIGGVWWAAHQVAVRVQHVTEQADQTLTQVEDGLGRMQKELESTSEAVEAVRTAAREWLNSPGTKAELERIRDTLLPLLERTDALREVLPSVATLVDNVADFVEQTGQEKSRSQALRSVAGNVRDAAGALEAVRRDSAALRQKMSALTAKDLASLAERARRPVDLLATGLSDTKQESASLRAELPKLRRLVDDWKILGPAIITGILLWIGLGQLAIVAWGRRRLAARTATA